MALNNDLKKYMEIINALPSYLISVNNVHE